MRIVAGAWRGRTLAAPRGTATRPTADRVRQALFDRLLHAPWGGRACIEGALVLDAFAGTGALGLEALSRGAAHATFFETDRAALAALRANVAACDAGALCTVLAVDATAPPSPKAPCRLVFLDPPYRRGLPLAAIGKLAEAGWLAPSCLLVVETAHDEALPPLPGEILDERRDGPARISVLRVGPSYVAI